MPPECLAAVAGIKVYDIDLPGSVKESGKVWSPRMVRRSKGLKGLCQTRYRQFALTIESILILLSVHQTRKKRAFTFAHELAHAARSVAKTGLHPEWDHSADSAGYLSGQSDKAEESLCDRVAREILMPADLVLLELFHLGRVSVPTMARKFNVTLKTMSARLADMGLR